MSDIVARVGMVVRVTSVDGTVVDERGEIINVETLTLEETGEVLSDNYPTIRVASGRELGGLYCWWTPWGKNDGDAGTERGREATE